MLCFHLVDINRSKSKFASLRHLMVQEGNINKSVHRLFEFLNIAKRIEFSKHVVYLDNESAYLILVHLLFPFCNDHDHVVQTQFHVFLSVIFLC